MKHTLGKGSGKDFSRAFNNWNKDKGLQEPSVIKRTILPPLEAELKVGRKTMEDKAYRDAEDTANRSRPREHGDSITNYILYIATEISEHCNNVHTRLQTKGLERYKKQVLAFEKTESEILGKKKSKLDNDISNQSRKVRNLKERDIYNWVLYPFLVAFVGIMLLVDMIYNASAFQALGFSFLKSSLIAFVAVSSLGLFGYGMLEELKKDETMKRSQVKIYGYGLFIMACFFGIGFLRVYYMNQMGGQTMSVALGTLVFITINVLIFGGTSLVFERFFPTKTQRKIHNDYIHEKKSLTKKQTEFKGIENDQKMLRAWVGQSIREADDLMDYANALLKENIAFYHKVVANWKREVCTRLPYIPDCMEQKIPEVQCEFVIRKDDGNNTSDAQTQSI